MGGKGSGSSGGGTTTVNSTQSPPPQVLAAYQNVVNQAQNVASQPLQQYTGPMIAGFTPAQMQSMQTVNNAQGVANPYINAAAQYAGQSATPIAPTQYSADQVQQYMNPYTQNVVNTTQAEFNNQNQQQAQQQQGQAIAQGAFGGDREAIAQAELANQQQLAQAPTIAGLNQQNYSQALGEFNTQQQVGVGAQEATGWLGSNAGYAMGNLGNEAQNTALTGASAQLQSGALQQQLAQEELNVPYEMFEQQQAYPYQQANFLAGITEGVGGLEGGTSSTTSPTASTASQAAGLGIAGLGALGSSGALSGLFSSGAAAAAQRGGRVPRDMGGGLSGFDHSDASDVNQLLTLTGESSIPLPDGGNNNVNTVPGAPAPNALAGLGPDPSSSSSDSGGGWGGALQGGAEGAMIGTEIFPGWGTAIGAGVGALVGGLSNRGGRVKGYDSGGSLPSVPDVSISYVPAVASAGGGRGASGIPGAPKAAGTGATNPLSDLQQGISYGKLFKNGNGTTGSIANSPSGVPGVGSDASQFPFTGSDLAAADSYDAAQNSGGIFSFDSRGGRVPRASGGGFDYASPATDEAAAQYLWNNRGGRVGRDAGGATGSPMIAGFTAAPGHPDISIPVLSTGAGTGGTGGSVGGGSGATAGFAIPTAPIGTNIANATPAPAGQLDINPSFNWSPPDPNSLSHTTVGPAPTPAPTPAPVAGLAGSSSGNNGVSFQPNGGGDGGAANGNGGPGGMGATGPGPGGEGEGDGTGNGGPGAGGDGDGGGDGGNGDGGGGGGGDGGGGGEWRGGTVHRYHRDAGGTIMASGDQTAGQPVGGGNPLVGQQYQQLAQLPTEKLQELAQRVPPTSAQGAMIQRAVQARKMNPGAAPQPQQAGFAQAPSPYGTFAGGQGQAQAQPQMAQGGLVGYEAGGPIDDKLRRIAGLQSDRAASDRGERAAGSPASPFSSMVPPPPRPGFADGGDPNDAPPPPTQVQSLSGMTDEDLVATQDNPRYSPALVGREMESRGIRSGWGNLVHSVGSGLSDIGSHFRDAAAAGPADAVTPEQAQAGAQTTANAARGVGDWFTKPIIPGQAAQPAQTAPARSFQRAEAGSPSETGPEDYRGKVLRRDDPSDQPAAPHAGPYVAPSVVVGGDDGKGGDQSPAGVAGFGPRDQRDAPPLAAPPYPQSKPAPPDEKIAGLTPLSWTNPDTGTEAGKDWINPDTGKIVPRPQAKPPVPSLDEPARPMPTGGGPVGSAAPDQKTAGFQPPPPAHAAAAPQKAASSDWSQNPWLAVINAGAAMASGRSPSWMANAGEGIQAGTKTLGQQAQFAQTQKFQQAETDAKNRGYDIEAKKLDQALQEHKDTLAETHEFHGQAAAHQSAADKIAQQRADITDARERDYQQRVLDQGNRPTYVGPSTDPDNPGSVLLGRRPDGSYGPYIDPIKVGPKQDTAPIRDAQWLIDNHIAPDKTTAWSMARAGVKDQQGAQRWASQVQAEKNSLKQGYISQGQTPPGDADLEQQARQTITSRYSAAPAGATPQRTEQQAAPQFTADSPWKAPQGADEKAIREQFSKLPKGAVYINPSDGKLLTKN